MFELRFRIDAQPRSKNGQPAHSTTGNASTICSQDRHAAADARRDAAAGEHVAHGERHHRRRQRHARPEAARHVHELGIGPLLDLDRPRLERHAADRARARLVAHDLRVHRARVLGLRLSARAASRARAPSRTTGRARASLPAPPGTWGRPTPSRGMIERRYWVLGTRVRPPRRCEDRGRELRDPPEYRVPSPECRRDTSPGRPRTSSGSRRSRSRYVWPACSKRVLRRRDVHRHAAHGIGRLRDWGLGLETGSDGARL